MKRGKTKAKAAPVTTKTDTGPPPPPAPRYAWTGPPGPAIRFPGKNLVFRPGKMTDDQVTGILKRHPDLSRYFSDAQA